MKTTTERAAEAVKVLAELCGMDETMLLRQIYHNSDMHSDDLDAIENVLNPKEQKPSPLTTGKHCSNCGRPCVGDEN
jgi:predicted transcriptional regulator